MKVRVELNYDEVAALKSFNFIVTEKELNLPAIKKKSDKTGESVTTYDGRTLISESKINSMFVIDIFQIAGTSYRIVKPIAEKVVGMFKGFKNKWMKEKTEDEPNTTDLLLQGYRYKAESRTGKISYLKETNRIFVEPTTLLPLYNLLYIIDLESGKDVTRDVFSSITQKVLEKQSNRE